MIARALRDAEVFLRLTAQGKKPIRLWGTNPDDAEKSLRPWLARISHEDRIPWVLDLVCDHLTYVTHVGRSGLHCGELERASDPIHARGSIARARVHFYMGWHAYRRRYPEDALVRFRNAATILSRHKGQAGPWIRARAEEARMHAMKERYETARDMLAEIIHGAEPQDEEGRVEKLLALLLLGVAHWNLKDEPAAIDAMRDVVAGLARLEPELSARAPSALAKASTIIERRGLNELADVMSQNESAAAWLTE